MSLIMWSLHTVFIREPFYILMQNRPEETEEDSLGSEYGGECLQFQSETSGGGRHLTAQVNTRGVSYIWQDAREKPGAETAHQTATQS